MSELVENLKQELKDEDYRYAYDEEFANSRMALQIKILREESEMTQRMLAERADMKQERISVLENVNYSMWSISTLRRLARALGVRLSFKFESWGELLPEVETFSRKALEKPPFEKDPAFKKAVLKKTTPKKARFATAEQGVLPFEGTTVAKVLPFRPRHTIPVVSEESAPTNKRADLGVDAENTTTGSEVTNGDSAAKIAYAVGGQYGR